ncbi:MAG TPA: SurA N-terminal domain-containing protein [Vulgatibacter sp.]|nr:SurA N-terminal domain-containing protein [Vulgatibacter sp.]
MLDKMRASSRSFGMYLVFGALILVFIIYFGPGSNGCVGGGMEAGSPYAAKVNGDTIGWREFEGAYANTLRAYQQQMGERFDQTMAEQMGLKQNVLDQLVDRKLLLAEAKAQGIVVADSEVAAKVKEAEFFHKEGQFDFGTYKEVLANAGLTTDRYEADVRESLLVTKLLSQVRHGANASEEEIREEFRKDNDKANLTIVRFSSMQGDAEAAPTDAEVKDYLASEEGQKAVADEYEAKSFRFKTPKRVKAQHILVKVEEDAPQAEVDAATAKLEKAKADIQAGADFGELAKSLSEDPGSKDKGGDLGFFGPGTMAKPFEDAAMALEPGQLSEIVRTRFGLHLIKVNEVQPPEEKTLADVQDELAKELLTAKKAKDLARSKAEAALAKAKAGESLEALFPAPAEDAKGPRTTPSAEKTGSFGLSSDYVPRVGSAAALVRAVEVANAGDLLPEVYEVSGAFVIAQVDERQRPDISQLEAQRSDLRARILRRKEGEVVEAFTKNLRGAAKVETSPELTSAGS